MGRYLLLLILFLSFLLHSCIKEEPEEESKWNPNFSIAIGYTSLGMNADSGFDTLLLQINALTGLPYWTEEIDIPLSYTMPFDMGQISDFSEEIISIMFRLNTYNGFPNEALGQVYFLDMSNIIVDSLFSTGPLTLNRGIVNGETVNYTHNQTDIIFDQSKIEELTTVRNILVQGKVSNVELNTTLVDFYPNYTLGIQLGLQAELSMSISEEFSNQDNQ
jgi:hypothetical protein